MPRAIRPPGRPTNAPTSSITAMMATARATYAEGSTEPLTSKIPSVPSADRDQREGRPEQHQPGAARPRRRHVRRRAAAASRPAAAGCRYRSRSGSCSWGRGRSWVSVVLMVVPSCGADVGSRTWGWPRRWRREGCPRAAAGRGAAAALVAGREDRDHHQPDDQQREREAPAPAVVEERGAEHDHQRDRAGDDQHDLEDVGVQLDRGAVLAVLGDEQPDHAVHQDPGAAEEGEHDEQHADDRGVDVEVPTQAAGHAGDVAVAPAAAQPVDVAHLLAADAGSVLGAVWPVPVASAVPAGPPCGPLCSFMSSIVSVQRAPAVSGRVLISGALGLRVFT